MAIVAVIVVVLHHHQLVDLSIDLDHQNLEMRLTVAHLNLVIVMALNNLVPRPSYSLISERHHQLVYLTIVYETLAYRYTYQK